MGRPHSAMAELSPQEKRALLARLLAERTRQPHSYTLSLIQEPLWFLEQLAPGRQTYHMHSGFRLAGQLNSSALERALDEITRRHESLRTTFPAVDGQPVQRIHPYQPYRLPIENLSHLSSIEQEAEIERIAFEQARAGLDVENGPLWRAQLFRLGDAEHLLFLKMHHIISDGWSLGIFAQEVSALYEAFSQGRTSPLPPLKLHYRDYALWQRKRLSGAALQGHLNYWREKLASPLITLELPLKGPRPAVQTHHGAHRRIFLANALIKAAHALGRREQVTLFVVLVAAFKAVLARYTRQHDIIIGTPMANRPSQDAERIIGYFSNMVVLRSDLSGDPSFRELLVRVRQTVLDAYAHQELPLETLVQALRPQRDPSLHPLFQVMLVLQADRGDLQRSVSGLTFSPYKSGTDSTKFDLQLSMARRPEGFKATLGYNTDLFDSAVIERLLDHYQVLLTAAVNDPELSLSKLPLMDEDERRGILHRYKVTVSFPGHRCVHELVELQAASSPIAVAVEYGQEQLNYGQLNARANQLAHRLRRVAGIQPDTPVVVCMERSIDMVVSLLGILKAGGAYLPLDPLLPVERMRFVLEETKAPLLLTRGPLNVATASLPADVVVLDVSVQELAHESASNPRPAARPHHLAYILYTSGTTGRPKGVMVEHRSVVNYIFAATRKYAIASTDRVLQFASYSFDAHVEEIFPTLARGATLVLRSDAMLESYRGFLDACTVAKLTFLSLPTAYWHELVAAMETEKLSIPPDLRLLVIGGERALPERVAAWINSVGGGVPLINTYGPTEATVVATAGVAINPRDEHGNLLPVTIGHPLANVLTYVLDETQQPVPVGVPGELYLGGQCIARGYWANPELTQKSFIPDPFSPEPGARLYRTGDLVRWRPDGEIDFLGRVDAQVKVRGFRIEPEEIEAVMVQYPDVVQAAVIPRIDTTGGVQLVAFIATPDEITLAVEELRHFLAARLPSFMMPATFISLPQLPTTASGKIDRKALQGLESTAPLRREHAPPVTPTEGRVATLFAEVLDLEHVGRHDDFFELGGHSLLAVRLMAKLRDIFSVEMPLAQLFTHPTVAGLAQAIDKPGQGGKQATAAQRRTAEVLAERLFTVHPSAPLVPIHRHGSTHPNLFLIHGLGGHVGIYAELAQELQDAYNLYGLQAGGLDGKVKPHATIEEMATDYLKAIQKVQPTGPYFLIGWSMGGIIALELARQIKAYGASVDLLGMLDTHLPKEDGQVRIVDDDAVMRWIASRFSLSLKQLLRLSKRRRWRRVLERAQSVSLLPADVDEAKLANLAELCQTHIAAVARYPLSLYSDPVMLFRARDARGRSVRGPKKVETLERWQGLFPALHVHEVPGNHYSMLRGPQVQSLADSIRQILAGPAASIAPTRQTI